MSEIVLTPQAAPSGVTGKLILHILTGGQIIQLIRQDDSEIRLARLFVSSSDPTVDDDVDLGYIEGDIWLNTTTPAIYICADNSDGAADWQDLLATSGISDGDKGDITVSGSGTTWTIDAGVVSLAKLVSATAQYKLLGRVSAGSGSFEEISGSANVFSFLQASNYAAMRTLLSLVPGTDIQAVLAEGAFVDGDKTKLDGIETAADVTDATNVDAAGAVMEADYDANTVLAADADNTPAALTVAEQTVVGRITGGNIDALTVAELATLSLSAALPENTAVILDAALSADGKYSGIVEAGTAGATLAFGDLVYLAVADSRWELADASAVATGTMKIGICVLAAASDGDPTTVLLWGKVRADTAFPTLTVATPVFMSETAGDITNTAPSTSGAIVRDLGYGNTGDELQFQPSNDWIELS